MVEKKKAGILALLLGAGAALAGVAIAKAKPAPPPGAPQGELALKLEVVRSPSSPALVRAVVSVMATGGTLPIEFTGTLTSTYAGTVTLAGTIAELNVWVTWIHEWDVPAGETDTVTVSGELSNPWGTYTLAPVTRSVEIPGEPPVGMLAMTVEVV